MKCADVFARLEQLVDRELSDQELVEVEGHLHRCPECLERYAFQKQVRRVIRLCCAAETPESLRRTVEGIVQGDPGPA